MTVPQAIILTILVLVLALIPAALAFPWELALPWFVCVWVMMVLVVLKTGERQP